MHSVRLSAYLYNATLNQTYYDSANDAQMFIQSHLYDPNKPHYVMDAINLTDCSITNNFSLTFNNGLYLEALTILSKFNSSMKHLLARPT